MVKIFPSLMSANILELGQEIDALQPYCDGFHVDVMDFHFVPNLTIGPIIINAIAKAASKELFVHLMVEAPEKMIEFLQLPEHSTVAFHQMSTPKPTNVIKLINKKGWHASIALSPDDPIDMALPLLDQLNQVLVMSVRPGASGQEFIPHALEKVKQLAAYRKKKKLTFRIAIDGGVNEDNIADVVHAGADDLAIASAIFKTNDRIKALKKLKQLAIISPNKVAKLQTKKNAKKPAKKSRK